MMWKEALLSRPLRDQHVQCQVCAHYCTLAPGEWGKCGVRANREGTLYSSVYGQAVAAHIDPIEKKPLYHFLPGSEALSIGTYGCNLRCRWCQNSDISQQRRIEPPPGERILAPADLVRMAQQQQIAAIAYTYNEPTVFFEYVYDTARLAQAAGIKNIYVSNGYLTPEAINTLAPYLDGANLDLKGFTEDLYAEYTGARLEPVKQAIAALAHDPHVWIEVTTLVIPGLNDAEAELRAAAAWLAAIDPDMPWHVSAFHPSYKLLDRPPTPPETLERAYQIGKEAGLHYVYVGNRFDSTRENTCCPTCGALLIQRHGFHARTTWRTPGRCPACNATIAGVWEN